MYHSLLSRSSEKVVNTTVGPQKRQSIQQSVLRKGSQYNSRSSEKPVLTAVGPQKSQSLQLSCFFFNIDKLGYPTEKKKNALQSRTKYGRFLGIKVMSECHTTKSCL